MRYKHYSFDLWLTLIKSDPIFKQERDRHFFEKFNRKGRTLPEVSAIIKEVDNACNAINEVAGGSITPFEMYAMVLLKLDYPIKDLTRMDMIAIYHYIETLFLKHPPVPYSEDTVSTLIKLKRDGATLSILSNTGFIMGSTIKKLFTQHFKIHMGLDLNSLFIFQMYSDEMRASKPSQSVFDHLLVNCLNHHDCRATAPRHILHVGDNEFADAGAKQSFIDHMIINSNNKTIKNLLER